MIRLAKFMVQAQLIEVDADGEVINEHATQPQAIFGLKGLREYADEFPKLLDNLNNERNMQGEEA